MPHLILRLAVATVLLSAQATTPVLAQRAVEQERSRPDAPRSSEAAPRASAGLLSLLPPDSTTSHVVEANGRSLAYSATAGTLTLLDQNAERTAAIYYTAYTLKGAAPETRPVTFVFNGGPGASSAYLHLGLVGPRVADFGRVPNGADARLVSNPDTWLAFTDLVLIDPVGTGWSRAAKSDGAGSFWGVRQDAQALAKAVALYLGQERRASSPKYILGESYGGFRAIKVARALQQEQGLVVNGLVLVSPFLEGGFTFGRARSALTAALQLPSLAAAELDRRGTFTPEALQAAERFALTDYLVTLAGRPPEGEAARRFHARVAELTGLPVDVVARTRGFVREAVQKSSTQGRREIVSGYDATYSVPDPFPESAASESGDPMLEGFLQALGGLFVAYARHDLGYRTDMTFHLLNREVSGKWDWGGGRLQASSSRDMRELLALNPGLRILVSHGRSDIITPYGVSRYVLDHLPDFTYGRTRLSLYKGGHMFYFDAQSRAAFTAEARAFYDSGRE